MTAPWTFSPDVIRKARRYVEDGRVVRDPEVPGVWWVTGSSKSRRYRVQTDADPLARTATWINCTCPHGLHTGAGAAKCSHAVAVLLRVTGEGQRPLLRVVSE